MEAHLILIHKLILLPHKVVTKITTNKHPIQLEIIIHNTQINLMEIRPLKTQT